MIMIMIMITIIIGAPRAVQVRTHLVEGRTWWPRWRGRIGLSAVAQRAALDAAAAQPQQPSAA